MFSLGQFDVPATLRTEPGDHVLFCFGEVDVRVHLVKLSEQWGTGIHAAITQVTTRYVERIRAFCGQRQVKGHIIAAPPPAEKTNPEAVVPVVDALEHRVSRAVLVNDKLAELCRPDINLIDPWGPFRNPDGGLDMTKSDGIVHVADSFREVIRELVLPHFS